MRRERSEQGAYNQGSRLAPGGPLRAGYRRNRIGTITDYGYRRVDVLGQFHRIARLPTRALCDNRDRPVVLALHLFEETGALYFHLVDQGKGVAIPLDGTGPSYTANFFDMDLEGIRAVKNGDVLVEEDTDIFRTVMHGSDGSRAFSYFHAHSP